MAFRKKLFNRVASDAGFVVKIRSFQGFVEYREGDKVAKIPVYRVIGMSAVRVHRDTIIKWNPPYSSEVILEDKRKQILQNIVDAMQFAKCTAEMV
jgi:hypothetical protein